MFYTNSETLPLTNIRKWGGEKEYPNSEVLQKTSLMGWLRKNFANGAPISEVLLSVFLPPH